MATITVKLDAERAARVERWARRRRVSKSEIIRDLIDRGDRIETGDDLLRWSLDARRAGAGLGLKQRRR
jgi:predicted transcriptional regulator